MLGSSSWKCKTAHRIDLNDLILNRTLNSVGIQVHGLFRPISRTASKFTKPAIDGEDPLPKLRAWHQLGGFSRRTIVTYRIEFIGNISTIDSGNKQIDRIL